MKDEALVRAILDRVEKGETEIDITPKGDAADENELNDTMHWIDDQGLIKVTKKHWDGKWEIAGLTLKGKAYLVDHDMD